MTRKEIEFELRDFKNRFGDSIVSIKGSFYFFSIAMIKNEKGKLSGYVVNVSDNKMKKVCNLDFKLKKEVINFILKNI